MTIQEDSTICIIITLYLKHQFAHLSERSSSSVSQGPEKMYSVLHTSTPVQGSRLVTCRFSYYGETLKWKVNRGQGFTFFSLILL